MKLYLTAAGVYAGTQQEAKADGKGWALEEVPVSKYELIDYLNKLKHGLPDQAAEELVVELDADDPARGAIALEKAIQRSGYAEQAVSFEDGFAKMPLPLKLHFAALAMEEARDELIKEGSVRKAWASPRD